MEDNHHLLQPLLISSTTAAGEDDEVSQLNNISHSTSDSSSSAIVRLLLVAVIGVVSIAATHFSVGYSIAVENHQLDTKLGRRFHTFYVADDEAVRIIVRASDEVREFLYPKNTSYYHVRKKVNAIVLKLITSSPKSADDEIVTVDSGADHSFAIGVSASLMEGADFKQRVLGAVRRGVARVWLYDGAPANVTEGLVGYISGRVMGSPPAADVNSAADMVESEKLRCWPRDDVASLLTHLENRRPGFIRRLNREMMDGWDEGLLDRVFGEPLKTLCAGEEWSR